MRRYLVSICFALVLWSGHAAAQIWPSDDWAVASPADVGMDGAQLQQAGDYALLKGGGSGMIVRGGYKVYSWGDQAVLYDLKSTTKSIGGSALGLAIADNFVALPDFAQQYLPTIGNPPIENVATGWLDQITILQLAVHTAGFDNSPDYDPLIYAPATTWSYSNGGVNWLADTLTQTFGEDLNSLLFRRVFSPIGVTTADLVWRSNAYRDDLLNGVKRREMASGISANVDAMARIGYLYLREGLWAGNRLLPDSFVDTVRVPSPLVSNLPVADPVNFPGASKHYGVLWWTNADGTLPGVPTDAYWSWGLRDSLIIVIPSLDIVAVRAGDGLGRSGWNADYSWIAPFITPIAQSTVPAASVNPTSLAFGKQALNLASTGMTVTIANTGAIVLPISSITLTGTSPDQFSQSTNCPSQVPVGGTCTATVVFKPNSTGTKSAALTIALGGGATKLTVVLSGTGVRSKFSVSPTSLAFGNVAKGTTSPAQTVTITNTGTVVLPITSIKLGGTSPGQFASTNNCPAQVAVGGSCTANVVFRPTSSGTKSANLKILPGGGASAKTVALSGTGI